MEGLRAVLSIVLNRILAEMRIGFEEGPQGT